MSSSGVYAYFTEICSRPNCLKLRMAVIYSHFYFIQTGQDKAIQDLQKH